MRCDFMAMTVYLSKEEIYLIIDSLEKASKTETVVYKYLKNKIAKDK
jgi:hypothetical protein